MTPLTVDVPHRLGRAAARDRIRTRIGELAGHIPGGLAEVDSSWTGENRMDLRIRAMGQDVAATLDIKDTVVTVELRLPAMLGFFTGAIRSAVREGGERMLEDNSKRQPD